MKMMDCVEVIVEKKNMPMMVCTKECRGGSV